MAEALVEEYKSGVGKAHGLASIELIPSGGGVFDVEADGKLIFSKKQAGRHAEVEEVLQSLREL